MVLPIYVYGTEILREKAKAADISTEENRAFLGKLIEDMEETMHKGRRSRGWLLPQVGHSLRVLTVDGFLLSEDNPELKDFNESNDQSCF